MLTSADFFAHPVKSPNSSLYDLTSASLTWSGISDLIPVSATLSWSTLATLSRPQWPNTGSGYLLPATATHSLSQRPMTDYISDIFQQHTQRIPIYYYQFKMASLQFLTLVYEQWLCNFCRIQNLSAVHAHISLLVSVVEFWITQQLMWQIGVETIL